MLISLTLRRNRLIALVAAVAMVTVVCGYAAHDPAGGPSQSCHCDWTMHFTGVAGSAPQPVPVVKAVLAGWRLPSVAQASRPGTRRVRSHLARAPPLQLSIA
ncbi:MAG TPA: hypothetical protein VHV80_11320 [Steroidobacteraceae bacterium]|jgi:hypothetical protein|nr:hypothetical protein [Steroidobacteraceae bacterium]